MNAEVIAIGDELTSGQRLDTNSQWLSEQLGDLGIRVVFHSTVADDLDSNVRVFLSALDRADIVIATGGLGPTADDLTRQALAQATETRLVLDQDSLEHICARFARSGRDMPKSNDIQAMFPEGSRVIPNPDGTAPGIDLQVNRDGGRKARVFALPGVPAEMRQMWDDSVAPALRNCSGDRRQVIRHRRIKCFGAGESHLEQMLPDLIRRGRSPSVGITAHQATITLRITAVGETEERALAAMEPTIRSIHEALGDLVFGEGDDELHHVVTRMLVESQATLATVECGSGGLIAHWMESAAQFGNAYLGGLTLLGQNASRDLLDVPQSLLESEGLVSEMVARDMAQRVRQRFGASLGLAVSPFPSPSTDPKTPSRYYIAMATDTGVHSKSSTFLGHPDIWKERSGKQSLDFVRHELLRERKAVS